MATMKRPIREIPNPQVLDAAKQFREGFLLMIAQPPCSGVLLPALHCASIALELYLKSCSAHEIEVPDSAFPGASYIYAESQARSHKLEDLFDQAPSYLRDVIEKGLEGMPRLYRFSSVRDALEAHNGVFMASRYPFEPTSDLGAVEMEALSELLQLLESSLRGASHQWIKA